MENFTEDEDLKNAEEYLRSRYDAIRRQQEDFPLSLGQDQFINSKLLLTDLFVEKDIQVLTRRAKEHTEKGNNYFKWSVTLFFLGAAIALSLMGTQVFLQPVEKLEWSQLLQMFIKQFTAYGFIVLTAVALWKQSKARLDQAERLKTKRRINRILQLLVYLQEGNVNSDDIDKIIKLGVFDENAFTKIVAEGKSPISGLVSEILSSQKNTPATSSRISESGAKP